MSGGRPRTRFIGRGHIFGRGEVLEEIRMLKGSRSVRGFRLQCTCGNTYEARLDQLAAGNSRSCGCINDEKRRQRFRLVNLDRAQMAQRLKVAEEKLAAVAEAKQDLVAAVLASPHHYWRGISACQKVVDAEEECNCGRDAQVERLLRILAGIHGDDGS